MTVPLFGAEQEVVTSDDYYTPAWLFEDMGIRFDVDVAAPPGGVPWIPADRFLTKADDGLAQEWVGRVWMNPPYSKPAPWVDKFLAHGDGVALLPLMKAAWLFDLWAAPASVVFLPTRTQFVRKQEGSLDIMWAVALWAVGSECVEAIGRVGHVR